MKDVKLGRLIEGDASRDAIHIAIAPVVAGEALGVADHVKFNAEGLAVKAGRYDGIGIVDPFLRLPVIKGEKFWICLYQQTITGMRHHWIHPAFRDNEERPESSKMAEAREWMMDYATSLDFTYEQLIQGGRDYLSRDEYLCGGDAVDSAGCQTDPEFWIHFETLTGLKGQDSFFRCAC